jgi:hypothetical protein
MPLSGRAAFSNCRSPHPWQENKPAAHHSPLPINRSPQTHHLPTTPWHRHVGGQAVSVLAAVSFKDCSTSRLAASNAPT